MSGNGMRRSAIQTLLATGLLLVAGSGEFALAQTFSEVAGQYINARNAGRFPEALRLARIGRSMAEAAGNRKEAAICENEIGLNLLDLGQYDEAEAVLKNAVAMRISLFGDDSEPVVESRHNLAKLYYVQGRLDESEAILRRAIAIRERSLGASSTVLAATVDDLGAVLAKRGKFAEAEALHKKALAVLEPEINSVPRLVASAHAHLGEAYLGQGRFDEAIVSLARALRMREYFLPPTHAEIGFTLNNLAFAYKEQGRFIEAVPLMKRALGIFEKAVGPDHPETLTLASNLGVCILQDFRYAEAEALFQRAIDGRRKAKGSSARSLAIDLSHLGRAYSLQGRKAEAEPLYREALKILEGSVGRDDLETARMCNALATLLIDEGKLAEARELTNRALPTFEKALGPDHPTTGFAYSNLASIADKLGDQAGSLALWTRSLSNLERAGSSPGERFTTLYERGTLLWRMGRRDEAVADLKKALDLAEQRRVLSAVMGRQRAERFAAFGKGFETLSRWQAELGDAEGAFRTMERFRSRSLLDQMDSINVKKARPALTRDEQRQFVVEDGLLRAYLEAFEKERNRLLQSGRPADDFAVKSVEGSIAEYRKKLAEQDRRMQPTDSFDREVLSAIVAGLPTSEAFKSRFGADMLLLEYLLGEEGCYVSAIGPGPARVVPLVVAEAEAKVLGIEPGPLTSEKLRRTLLDAKSGVVTSLADPSRAEAVSARLAALWRVLVPEADRRAIAGGDVHSLIIAPDGALALLPFEALVVEEGPELKYLLDAGPPIAYAPSATVLYNLAGRADRPTVARREPVLTLGDPAYPAPAAVGEANRAPSAALSPSNLLRASGLRLNRLPFTAWETTWVAKAFTERGDAAFSLSGPAATEAAVRLNVPGRRVIHLACHGLSDQAFGNLIGALALTPGPRADLDPSDDGFLTLPEVYGLDLKGCELAILSACQTNLGPEQRGEGTWTLSRGFLVAGARRVVASNWLVDDEAEASLMSVFCTRVARGEKDGRTIDHARAMQDARRWVRGQEKWKSPYFWAPSILVGPPRAQAAPPEGGRPTGH